MDSLGKLVRQIMEETVTRILNNPSKQDELKRLVEETVEGSLKASLQETVTAIVRETTETTIRKALKK